MRAAHGRRGGASASVGGFTLVEVMVALVILAVGALTLTRLALSVAVLMQQSSDKTVLIAQAENRLEAVQARPYSALTPGVEEDTLSVRGTRYLRRVTITAPGPRTRRIAIDLRASEGGGVRYSALTYVSAP